MSPTILRSAIGLSLGLLAAHVLACGEQSDDPRALTTCSNYCQRANECDDREIDDCNENCRQFADDCVDDELDEALDRLDRCAGEVCSEFTECTIGAGIECIFGV